MELSISEVFIVTLCACAVVVRTLVVFVLAFSPLIECEEALVPEGELNQETIDAIVGKGK